MSFKVVNEKLEAVKAQVEAAKIAFEKAEWAVHVNAVPENIEKGSNLCLFRDGSYLLRKNKIGTFFRKMDTTKYPGLDNGPEGFFKFHLPKIPKNILKQQVSFYREVMDKHNDAEAYSIIMYDIEEERYFLYIPKQKIDKSRVIYLQPEFREDYPSNRYIEVASCHSHNSMSAYFSSMDDNDEKGDMLYMVMGFLDKDVPKYKIRASVSGKQACFLELEDLFDITVQEWETLTADWRGSHEETWMEQLEVVKGAMSQAMREAGLHEFGTFSNVSDYMSKFTHGKGNKGRHKSYQGEFDFESAYAFGGSTRSNYGKHLSLLNAARRLKTAIENTTGNFHNRKQITACLSILFDQLTILNQTNIVHHAISSSLIKKHIWLLPDEDEEIQGEVRDEPDQEEESYEDSLSKVFSSCERTLTIEDFTSGLDDDDEDEDDDDDVFLSPDMAKINKLLKGYE